MADSKQPSEKASPSEAQAQLVDLRRRIDALDDQVLALLDQRARTATEIARAKRRLSLSLHDPEREQQLVQRLEAAISSLPDAVFPKSAIRPVWREVMSACLSLEQPLTVAYLGPPGTFTHMAACRAFGLAAHYVEANTIPGVFDAVSRGRVTYGVAPIENSTEGGVTFTYDSLLDGDLMIRQELVLDVAQCLIGQTDELGSIERVYSHPQALAQCRNWLAKNLPNAQLVVSPSTTLAAREAASDPSSAAVASRMAAEITGLVILREGIQDHEQNATRFVILAKTDAPPTGDDKTTIVFSTPDQRGALRGVLEVFDHESINLTRIESRPLRNKIWEYVFFTDLEGHRSEPRVERALARLAETCRMTKVLGSYPRAK
jgi:chorismate mutase/prephenate dehydratase